MAKRIRFYVLRAGLSRAALAAKLGVTEQAVYQWWNGKKNQPTLINLARIAKLCGITLQDFVGPLPSPKTTVDDEETSTPPVEETERKAAGAE